MKRQFGFLIMTLLVTLILSFSQNAYASHDDFVVLGNSAAGPAVQVIGVNGTFIAGAFVLNATFLDLSIDPDVRVGSGSGHERILVCGNSAAGPAYQLYERDLSLPFVSGAFFLNSDFPAAVCLAEDADGDGVDEIIVVGQETTGNAGGWAIQVFDQAGGAPIFSSFLLNSTFTSVEDFIICFADRCDED